MSWLSFTPDNINALKIYLFQLIQSFCLDLFSNQKDISMVASWDRELSSLAGYVYAFWSHAA